MSRSAAPRTGAASTPSSRRKRPRRTAGAIAGSEFVDSIFEDAPAGLAVVAVDGEILAVNRVLAQMLGVERTAAIGESLLRFVYVEDRESARSCLESVSSGSAPRYDAERRYVDATGRTFVAQESGARTSLAPDGRARIVVQLQDVTGRREAAASLAEREARLQLVLAQIPAVLWTTDTDLRLTSSLGRHLDLLERPRDRLAGTTLKVFFGRPEPDFPALAAHQRALKGESISLEIEWRGRVFRTRVEPLLDADGAEIIGTIGVASDVTELQRIASALRSSEAKFRTLAETMNTAALIYRGSGVVYANPAAQEALGYSMEEMRALPFWDLARSDHRELVRSRASAGQRGVDVPRRFELCLLRKSGEDLWVDYSGTVIDYDGTPAVLATAFDITERKRAEAAVRESEERLRTMFEKSPLGMALLDHELRLVDANAALSGMVGFTREEILSMTLLTASHPDEAEKNLSDIRTLLDERVPAVQRERRFIRKNGETGWFRLTASAMKSSDGPTVFHLVMVEDVTEQRRSEELARRHRAELSHVLRLRSMGELAAGLAHELNQPLAAVVGFAKGSANRLRSGDVSSGEIIDKLEQIAREALRAGSIIKWVQRFLRKEKALREPTEFAVLLGNIAHVVEAEARQRDIELRIEVAAGLPPVPLEPVQIEQVIFNLVRNAFEAIAEKDAPEPAIVQIRAAAEGGQLVVTVRDTGPGLGLGDPERVFEPFYSSKTPEGMGLGLSISRSIVESHGGRLFVASTDVDGTTFRMDLPLDDDAGDAIASAGTRGA